MPMPNFIERILDWFIKFKLYLLKTDSRAHKTFPILRLPFLAQKNVLWMLKLDDLIPLSLLSKRCKRIIKYALPSKKTQYNCRVYSRKSQTIEINSRFGFYFAFEPHVDHVIDLLSYPPIRVVIDGEDAVIRATEWIKTHQQFVKEIVYLTRCSERNYKNILEFVNQFIEFNVRIELDRVFAIVCSTEEVRIENPTHELMPYIWDLKCRKLRIVDRPLLAEMFTFSLITSVIGASSVKQVILEIQEPLKTDWILFRGKKIEKEFQHPIYGRINEYYMMYNISRKVILFETHHDGKQLLIVDII